MKGVATPGATVRRRRQAVLAAAAWVLAAAAAHADSAEGATARLEESVAAVLAIAADPDYGAYLAGDCVTCHRPSGGSDGIPPIAGLPVEHIVKALVEYRLGLRDNEVMTVRAARLGDEEIAALAAHFAAQTP